VLSFPYPRDSLLVIPLHKQSDSEGDSDNDEQRSKRARLAPGLSCTSIMPRLSVAARVLYSAVF